MIGARYRAETKNGRNESHQVPMSIMTSTVDSQRAPAISFIERPATERRLELGVDPPFAFDPTSCAGSASASCDEREPERSAPPYLRERAIQRSAPPSSASANATENRTGSALKRGE